MAASLMATTVQNPKKSDSVRIMDPTKGFGKTPPPEEESSVADVNLASPPPSKDGLQSFYAVSMVPFLLSSIFLFYVALSANFLDSLFSGLLF